MGEETKIYKYTSNKDHTDGTEEIRLPGREPVRKGGEVELTSDEYELLKGRLNLHEVDSAPSSGQGNATQESGNKSDSAK